MDNNGVISEMQLKQKKIFCASDRKFYRKHWGGGCNYELELLCLDRIVNLTVRQIKIIISLSVWFIFILFAKLPSCKDCKALTFNENISNTKSKLLSLYISDSDIFSVFSLEAMPAFAWQALCKILISYLLQFVQKAAGPVSTAPDLTVKLDWINYILQSSLGPCTVVIINFNEIYSNYILNAKYSGTGILLTGIMSLIFRNSYKIHSFE